MDTKRNFSEDLAICNDTLPGPWSLEYDKESRRWQVICDRDSMLGSGVVIAECAEYEDARFIVEARSGWPYAIKYAIDAEEGARFNRQAYEVQTVALQEAQADINQLRAELGRQIEELTELCHELIGMIIPNESEYKCDYRRDWARNRLQEILVVKREISK